MKGLLQTHAVGVIRDRGGPIGEDPQDSQLAGQHVQGLPDRTASTAGFGGALTKVGALEDPGDDIRPACLISIATGRGPLCPHHPLATRPTYELLELVWDQAWDGILSGQTACLPKRGSLLIQYRMSALLKDCTQASLGLTPATLITKFSWALRSR